MLWYGFQQLAFSVFKFNVPESNVVDVIDVSSVEADNPPKQLMITMTATLMARDNIMEDKLGKNQLVFRK